MHFDTILKSLLQSSCLRLLKSLTGAPVREWINVEIPNARMSKLDLVAWLTDGRLYHLELQSGNDPEIEFIKGGPIGCRRSTSPKLRRVD